MTGFGIGLAIFALVIALVGLIKLLAWVDRVHEQGLSSLLTVKHYESNTGDVMLRASNEAKKDDALLLQTDARQTPDRPMIPVPTPEEMLDIFRVLRSAGVKREELRVVWKAARLPLDNNLWSQAAPPEPQTVTPIAGRPTNAQFHDPELSYQPPPK